MLINNFFSKCLNVLSTTCKILWNDPGVTKHFIVLTFIPHLQWCQHWHLLSFKVCKVPNLYFTDALSLSCIICHIDWAILWCNGVSNTPDEEEGFNEIIQVEVQLICDTPFKVFSEIYSGGLLLIDVQDDVFLIKYVLIKGHEILQWQFCRTPKNCFKNHPILWEKGYVLFEIASFS